MLSEQVDKITSRHIARCLDKVKAVGTPDIVLNEIKREMWYLAEDVKQVIRENENDCKESSHTQLR